MDAERFAALLHLQHVPDGMLLAGAFSAHGPDCAVVTLTATTEVCPHPLHLGHEFRHGALARTHITMDALDAEDWMANAVAYIVETLAGIVATDHHHLAARWN